MPKIKCLNPNHQDANPSMEVYEEYYHCYSCGYHELRDANDEIKIERKPPTDIPSMISYISTLPIKTVRGLQLPYNDKGYFVVWPNKDFYKQRVADEKTRYIGPRGHKPPLFVIPGGDKLVVIEGELNALSLALDKTILNTHTIVSPGSATELIKHVDKYVKFSYITIIVDKDIPGVANGLALKQKLLQYSKDVRLIAVEEDANSKLEKGEISQWRKDVGL